MNANTTLAETVELAGQRLSPGKQTAGDSVVYEYGVRLDAECTAAAHEQIRLARALYNDLVATTRDIVEQMQTFVLENAEPRARELVARVDELNADFAAARAANDEAAMKQVALTRREAWRELAPLMGATRKALRTELNARFFSRIGKNSSCDTYAVRCKAVTEGLGWATANAVLDSAVQAFQKSIKLGRAPRFAVGSLRTQDSLTLQFTAAGGVSATTLLEGAHKELGVVPTNGCGRRKYGEFRFRLGAAKAKQDATGTWQYHRPIPEGAHIGMARLVRKRIGKDTKWALQLLLRLSEPVNIETGERKPLVAVHFGWAMDVTGRRVAAVTDAADPGAARLLQLPYEIETELARAAKIQSERDAARDALVPLIKQIEVSKKWPEELQEEVAKLRKLPAQHIAISRLHRLRYTLREADSQSAVLEWLDAWRLDDRQRWQDAAHIARRARNRRRDFYRVTALDLARRYEAIVIEPLDLAGAAEKIDPQTGERNEFGAKARAGRVVAALYEFESALRWAAVKTDAALLDLVAPTASACAYCGGTVSTDKDDHRQLNCADCGALIERKVNGAACAWQIANAGRDDAVSQYWIERAATINNKNETNALKRERMAAGRRAARAASEAAKALE